MNKRIIVTGASSQIGDFLLPMLQESCEHVFAVSRKEKQATTVTWVHANIEESKGLFQQLPQADTLIHMAPLVLLPKILDVMQQKGIKRIIAFGTTSMFAKKTSHTRQEQHMVKALEEAEQLIAQACQQRKIDWTIFRPTLIYGCGKDKNISFIAHMMKKYRIFPIVGKASGLRQPVHSKDLAWACVQALQCQKSYNKAYNLSGAETLSYKEMLQRVMQVEQLNAALLPIPLPLFRTLVKIVNLLPKYRYLTPDMANRMNQDLCFSHQEASDDFAYQPCKFQPSKLA